MPQISYLNASEHQLNLSFSEILFLRDFCRSNDIMFCSTMGGCESIRDLQESKYLGAEATEYPYIESQFALAKIFTALDKALVINFWLIPILNPPVKILLNTNLS